jgi:uncharacterized membrane protein
MLKMGIPVGAVEQALQREGKDRSIASMDPNRSYSSQIQERKSAESKKAEHVALKDDPEYSKFFKVSCISCLVQFLLMIYLQHCIALILDAQNGNSSARC